jgi:predicted dehydrogenase
MVGGGENAFIGGVHRMAARLDGQWELVAGAFQSDPVKSITFGRSLGLDDARCYGDYISMAASEQGRDDRIDAVSVVTPNSTHARIALAFLAAGIPVICDKPLTINKKDAHVLSQAVAQARVPFILTHNYSGYPMIRQARAMVEAGELGEIRIVQTEYAQDWLATDVRNKQADWRGDPSRAGPGGALGDIATHAFQLAEFVTRLEAKSVAADLSSFVAGRKVDDNVNILLRFPGAARGMLWASQVATGSVNGLRLRVFGDKAGIEWEQETPEMLQCTPLGQPPRIYRRGGPGLAPSAAHATRIPGGHPEGYLEGFAQIYSDAAELIRAHQEKREPKAFAKLAPGIEDGVRGVKFIEAAVTSSGNNGAWTPI